MSAPADTSMPRGKRSVAPSPMSTCTARLAGPAKTIATASQRATGTAGPHCDPNITRIKGPASNPATTATLHDTADM